MINLEMGGKVFSGHRYTVAKQKKNTEKNGR